MSSPAFINANTHLKWECKEGHRWKMTPYWIARGMWCPTCKKEAEIKERYMSFVRRANEMKGKLLSTSLKDDSTQLNGSVN
jgi:hypothetical protein